MSNYMKLKIICPKMPDNNSNMDLAKQRKQILHEWQIKYKRKNKFSKTRVSDYTYSSHIYCAAY